MKPSVEYIQEIWPLSEVVVAETLKESEKGRTIIRIKAREGEFTYRIADESKNEESLRKELFAFSFLPEHGFQAIPKLIPTRDGQLFHPVNGRYACMLEFIDGTHPEPTIENYTTLGTLTAQLHNTKDYPYATEFDADFIAKNHLKDRGEQVSFKDEYLEIAAKLPAFNHFSKALIHTDVGLHNSIQDKDGKIYFIDWDDVGIGPALLDIGFPLIQQFIKEDLSMLEDEARAFYAAYFSLRPMSDEEKRVIFDAAVFIALDYIVYGENPEKRFDRLKWAIRNRSKIESIYLP